MENLGDKSTTDPYLPHEVVLDNILTKLPVKTLLRFGGVCKLWYNSIHHDPHFLSTHFLHSQNNPSLIFSLWNFPVTKDNKHQRAILSNFFFAILNVHVTKDYKHHDDIPSRFLNLTHDEKDIDGSADYKPVLLFNRIGPPLSGCLTRTLVGHCNGLVCHELWGGPSDLVEIFNPSRAETLVVLRPIFSGYGGFGFDSYGGFGFDSLTSEYKVVYLVSSINGKNHLKCLVFTLGTDSWRETTVRPPNPHRLFRMASNSATFCGGALVWMTRTRSNELSHESMLVLLSFDLHDETFQFIQVPDECALAKKRGELVRLLEYDGSICLALREITLGSVGDQNSSKIRYKVHLHTLKDKVKQVWIAETFDILSPRSSYKLSTTTPIVSFSDRVLLYSFNGRALQLYDLHAKQLMVVRSSSYDGYFFERRLHCQSPINYQLHYFIENFISLKTFVPEGARRLDDLDAVKDFVRRKPGAGFLNGKRKKVTRKSKEGNVVIYYQCPWFMIN